MGRMTEFSVIGERYPRQDAWAKASGSAQYLGDIAFPGQLEAAVLRSPYPRARVASLDFRAALEIPGVVAVIGPDDLAGTTKGRAFKESPPIQTILTRYPMYVGDAVAAVAAESLSVAMDAVAAIDVEFEELPPLLSVRDAAVGDIILYEDAPGNRAGPFTEFERGDVESGFAAADVIFEDAFETQRQCAQTIEPMSCVCRWVGDTLEVWTHLDSLFHLRDQLAEVLGIAPERVRLRATEALGATFGLKNTLICTFEPVCALLAQRAGAPVRLALSPEESMYTTVTRHPALIRLRTGISKAGHFTAREADVTLDAGACGFGYVVVQSMLNKWGILYHTANVRYRGRAFYTNHTPAGAYRAVGSAQIHFAMESQVDEICRQMGWDPVQFRLKNIVRQGDQSLNGTVIKSLPSVECIEAGAAIFGWPRRREANDTRFARGCGMSVGLHHSGVSPNLGIRDRSECVLHLSPDGTVVMHSALVDKGQGALSTVSAIVSEILGVPLNRISCAEIDTLSSPFDAMGAEVSRTTYTSGRAAATAAHELRTWILNAAAETTGLPPENLTVRDGAIVHESGRQWSLESVLPKDVPIQAFGVFEPERNDQLLVLSADFCEVAVDRVTGIVQVLSFVAVQDVGRVINRLGCEGQIEGGVLHGLGYALTEELAHFEGQPVNPTFMGYRQIMVSDMPPVTSVLIESPDDESGPFGAKGIGTGVVPAVAPAVCNAIRDAIGVRIRHLPATPARLVAALEGAPSDADWANAPESEPIG